MMSGMFIFRGIRGRTYVCEIQIHIFQPHVLETDIKTQLYIFWSAEVGPEFGCDLFREGKRNEYLSSEQISWKNNRKNIRRFHFLERQIP